MILFDLLIVMLLIHQFALAITLTKCNFKYINKIWKQSEIMNINWKHITNKPFNIAKSIKSFIFAITIL